jgi:hypothetical protein
MKEQELFDWLKSNYYSDLTRSSKTFDHFDCTTDSLYIELKCRYTHYPDLLIEEIKYRRLVNEAGNLTPYYINSTPEGIFSFNLSKLPEPEWADKWMPTTTEFANTKKIMKKVGFLDISLAKRLDQISTS